MQLETDGLIKGEKSVGESDRLVTALTREEGVVRALAGRRKSRGTRRFPPRSFSVIPALPFTRGGKNTSSTTPGPSSCFLICERILNGWALAQYFCELARSLAPQEAPAGDFLRLLLNAFHFLCKGEKPLLC